MVAIEAVDRLANCKQLDAEKLAAIKPKLMKKLEQFAGLAVGECWNLGSKGTYAVINLCGRNYPAHRIAFQVYNGDIPDGYFVAHKCDNKQCVNPAHLEVATAGKNTRDAFKRGLVWIRKGDKSASAKMTEAQVIEAFEEARKTGHGYRRIAKRLGLPPSALKDALAGRSWQHLNGGRPVVQVQHFNSRANRPHALSGTRVRLETVLSLAEVRTFRVRRYGIEPSQVRPVAELYLYEGLTGFACRGRWIADQRSCEITGYASMIVLYESRVQQLQGAAS